jgi:hypothetical protein
MRPDGRPSPTTHHPTSSHHDGASPTWIQRALRVLRTFRRCPSGSRVSAAPEARVWWSPPDGTGSRPGPHKGRRAGTPMPGGLGTLTYQRTDAIRTGKSTTCSYCYRQAGGFTVQLSRRGASTKGGVLAECRAGRNPPAVQARAPSACLGTCCHFSEPGTLTLESKGNHSPGGLSKRDAPALLSACGESLIRERFCRHGDEA